MITPPNIVPENRLDNNLLIATPSLRDGCFDKSVVFMIEHSSKLGSTGVILNHPTGKSVGELLSTNDFKPISKLPVYFGGPVENDQLLFASFEWTSATELKCDFRIPLAQAIAAHQHADKFVRVFVGHSRWQPNQLSNELKQHAWFTAFTRPPVLELPSDEQLWNATLRETSPLHHLISLTPDDPTKN